MAARKMHAALFFLLLPLIVLTSCDNGSLHHSRSKRDSTVAYPRVKLLKDALGWMTFRKNGQLMTDAQLEPLFLRPLLDEKYRRSKFYQTFVIAFQLGILPRLTLQENDHCDPAYTNEYKNPYNSSVTWHFQKKFTFDAYHKRRSSSAKFCDYRQGLVCKEATRKCQCPDGTVMQEIYKGSSVKRCLLQENEICALIDLDHGNDPKHPALARNLYHMIFNLEKPPGCKIGTQCRFNFNAHSTMYPRCYDSKNGGPWNPSRGKVYGVDGAVISVIATEFWGIALGTECALGLIADPGSCDSSSKLGILPGLTCYNFGPPRSVLPGSPDYENRTGFCAHEFGSFGISNSGSGSWRYNYHPLFIGFVNPRTVPLRDKDLRDFYRNYLDNIFPYFFQWSGDKDVSVEREGERCSVSRTETMEKAWKYFASLEDAPPPGKDYVDGATKAELEATLQSVSDFSNDLKMKVCRVYRVKDITQSGWSKTLQCVADGSMDGDGNDGKCQAPGKLDVDDFAKRFKAFLESVRNAGREQAEEENNYDRSILEDNPDASCSPNGRSCPDGFVCYEDYSDELGIYDSNCSLGSATLEHTCHPVIDGISYGKCEGQILEKKVFQEFEKMVEHARLGRGESCRWDLETDIRTWIRDGKSDVNKYKMLALLEESRASGAGGFCDRGRLLVCGKKVKGGTTACKCVKNTEPRKVMIDGTEYQSDYCYLPEGSCVANVTALMPAVTKPEVEKISHHYGFGQADDDRMHCSKNFCIFLDVKGEQCTTENTGETGYKGHDRKPEPTSGGGNSAGGPGWRHVGGASDLRGSKMVIAWSLASGLLLATMIGLESMALF